MTTQTAPLDDFDTAIANGALGTEVSTTRDRPPLGSFVFGPAYDGTCFIIKDNLLHYCKPKQPEAWPALFFIEVDVNEFPGKTGVFHNGQAHYFTTRDIFYIQGTGNGVFQPLKLNAKTGAQSIRGAVSVAGIGIFHTGPDGLYLYSSAGDRKITEQSMEPIFRGETVEGLPGVSDMSTSWLWAYQNHLYFGYASTGFTYPANLLVLNMETSRINHYTYNDGSDIEIRAIQTDHTNNRLLIGDSTGFVRVIEDITNTADESEAISFSLQSKEFTLPTRKHFPRWVKYDVDASDATTCTGALLLDGAIHHSHTISGNRITKRRLVGEGNGNKASLRISGTGPVSIYTAESE